MYLHLMLKRMMDICGSIIGIIILSPIYLIVAILVHRNLGSPIIFRQKRPGKNGKVFEMLKFRSMLDKTDKNGEVLPDKKRLTSFGMKLRSTSLDELPELFNVLKGDMSLIGPRPERPFYVEKFKDEIPKYMVKHQVRPGITGWAQVNGWRGDTSIKKRIECDIYYIENWSLTLDIKIVILTFFKGFINNNAY